MDTVHDAMLSNFKYTDQTFYVVAAKLPSMNTFYFYLHVICRCCVLLWYQYYTKPNKNLTFCGRWLSCKRYWRLRCATVRSVSSNTSTTPVPPSQPSLPTIVVAFTNFRLCLWRLLIRSLGLEDNLEQIKFHYKTKLLCSQSYNFNWLSYNSWITAPHVFKRTILKGIS